MENVSPDTIEKCSEGWENKISGNEASIDETLNDDE